MKDNLYGSTACRCVYAWEMFTFRVETHAMQSNKVEPSTVQIIGFWSYLWCKERKKEKMIKVWDQKGLILKLLSAYAFASPEPKELKGKKIWLSGVAIEEVVAST